MEFVFFVKRAAYSLEVLVLFIMIIYFIITNYFFKERYLC
ncbi:hypothetical protein MYRA21_3677 [Myroides sp. A21]|nr:hypothetical protein MYRA21_3677 [Myroides sp. A21]